MPEAAPHPSPFVADLLDKRARLDRVIELASAIAENAAAEALGRALPLPPLVDHDPPTKPAEATARFSRAANVVRSCTPVEIRLAREQEEGRVRARIPPSDPRRATLRENLRRWVDPALPREAQARLLRDIDTEVEAQLATDPAGHVPIGELFCRAGRALSLEGAWKDVQTAVLDFYTNAPWTPDPPPDPRHETHRLSFANYPDAPTWIVKDPWDQRDARLTTTIPLRDPIPDE